MRVKLSNVGVINEGAGSALELNAGLGDKFELDNVTLRSNGDGLVINPGNEKNKMPAAFGAGRSITGSLSYGNISADRWRSAFGVSTTNAKGVSAMSRITIADSDISGNGHNGVRIRASETEIDIKTTRIADNAQNGILIETEIAKWQEDGWISSHVSQTDIQRELRKISDAPDHMRTEVACNGMFKNWLGENSIDVANLAAQIVSIAVAMYK